MDSPDLAVTDWSLHRAANAQEAPREAGGSGESRNKARPVFNRHGALNSARLKKFQKNADGARPPPHSQTNAMALGRRDFLERHGSCR